MKILSRITRSKAVFVLGVAILWLVYLFSSDSQAVSLAKAAPAFSPSAVILPPPALLSEYSLIALNPAECSGQMNGLGFHGWGDLIIDGGGAYGGGIYVNGCLRGDGPVNVTVTDGGVYYAYDPSGGIGATFDPIPLRVDDLIYPQGGLLEGISQRCGELPYFGAHVGGGSIEPGNYDSIDSDSGSLIMQPGLYCLSGDFYGGLSGSLFADGVTIYMADGDLRVMADASQYFTAPHPGFGDVSGLVDLLIYMDPMNSGIVQISGNETAVYEGTFYVPMGELDVGGLSSADAQFIGWNVEYSASGDAQINYSGSFFDPWGVDYRLREQAVPDQVMPGETITYVLDVGNYAGLTATQVLLVDPLPMELTNVSIESTIPITPSGGSLSIWELPNLPPWASGIITITGQVTVPLPAGYSIVNTATITTTQAITIFNPLNDQTTVVVTVLNAAPQAVFDHYGMGAAHLLSVPAPGILGNDLDPNGDQLVALLDLGPQHGLLTLNPDGSFTYLPEPEYIGSDTFDYHTSDGLLNSNIAQVVIDVSLIPFTMTLSGPDSGWAGQSYDFYTAVEPFSATLPLVYTWQADGQDPITHTGGLSDTASFVWPLPGEYTLTVQAANYGGAVTDTHMITIAEVPIAGLEAASDSPTLLGSPTTLTATLAAGSNVVFTWDFGDGALGSGTVVTHTYAAVSIYTATVAASNSVGSGSAETQVLIQDVPVAGLQASNDSPTLLGEATTFTAVISAGTNVAFTWDFGDGALGSGAIVTHTYTATGIYTASAMAANSSGSTSATTQALVQADAPIAGLQAIADSPTLLGTSTIFTATVTGGTNVAFAWNFGDGALGIGGIVTHTYAAAGIYTATVTAANGAGSVSVTMQVQVTPPLLRYYLPWVQKEAVPPEGGGGLFMMAAF